MLKTIEEAAKNFCTHQIREEFLVEMGVTKKRTLIAYIDIEADNSKRYRAYIAAEHDFIQKVATLFLEEEESDEETLQDMTLETANLIIGSAKVIAKEKNQQPFMISTPVFEKNGTFDLPYNDAETITVDGTEFTIALKVLDD